MEGSFFSERSKYTYAFECHLVLMYVNIRVLNCVKSGDMSSVLRGLNHECKMNIDKLLPPYAKKRRST